MKGEDIARLFNGYLNIPFALIATAGNTLVLVAIWRTPCSLHCANNVLIFCLGMTDLGVGLIGQPLWIITELSLIENEDDGFLPRMAFTANMVFLGVSLLTVTLIGVDRYLAVKLHLRYQGLITNQRAVCVVVIIWVATFCFAITERVLRTSRDSLNFYRFTAFPVLAACLFINIFVYRKLYQICRLHHTKIQDQTVFQQDSDLSQRAVNEARFRKSVKTMFFIVLAFVLCYFPILCFTAATAILNYKDMIVPPIIPIMLNFTRTFVFVNSSVNPTLLIFQLTELRLAIKRILKEAFGRQQETGELTTEMSKVK